MSIEFLSIFRPVIVDALPPSPTPGDTCVLRSDGRQYTANAVAQWVPAGPMSVSSRGRDTGGGKNSGVGRGR